ncbi:putative membrane protein YeiH [Dysgonomonas sp. PFB1-18]|uniref:trimeric intracellular cation channel family protein n=1 Tax=unclassified Dysgonomonas TaxID=2630389 RepID=UPI00247608F5|nr:MULTISPECIES: trimeric intracellular cation channel family protein [unclassified Dysgonomonas]MDL2303696.1 trimeric intracellular cation channel family protein [Dysgonomonas sp. OttesenSCG-928-D17]MDH6307625.1 putative membrane protein YeiH [Dysgonomonas sp. PF1-14]MDH6337543.1 putative membrane protein YeiH [Dysgonomonas sp. PF1-16]MDH6378767.1 putative membrane protein YeiH [Dysgonomonas sp. PFB1-18]MDH6399185.1 putative membrane protein YeiH [Dysgonomonas sp. PF1-23]
MFLFNDLAQIELVDIIEFLGTIAFAISGIRLASAKRFDWFGAVVIGFVTAVGGGTLRDLLLDVPVFWMQASRYIWCTLFAFVVVLCFRKYLVHLNNTIFWFDCIGLGLFVVVGYEKAMALDYPIWVCVSMATITGIVGGIIRDILINEIPIIFTQELYAVACILGGILFSILSYLNVDLIIIEVSTAFFVVLIRVLATKYHLKLPVLKGEE